MTFEFITQSDPRRINIYPLLMPYFEYLHEHEKLYITP